MVEDEYNRHRRLVTQIVHFLIPSTVLGIICLGYDCYNKSLFPTIAPQGDFNWADRPDCDFTTFSKFAAGWVAMDVIALACSLLALFLLFAVEPASNDRNFKKTMVIICIGMFVLAIICEIAAEIMRIMMFANKIGLHDNIDYCIIGDQVDAMADKYNMLNLKRVVKLTWWFYPFTTFVCGLVCLCLHSATLGVCLKIYKQLKHHMY